MEKAVIRLSQCPVGTTFKYGNVRYVKTLEVKSGKKNYEPNCVRMDNNKGVRLHGCVLVEVIEL